MELLKGFIMQMEEDKRWRLKRDVSVADLISFCTAALAVVYAYTTLDKRVTLVESALLEIRQASKRQEDDSLRMQARIDVRLDKLDEKLERLLARSK